MLIHFATRNEKKAKRLQDAFARENVQGVTIQPLRIDLPEPRSEHVQVVALEKLLFAYKTINEPCAVVDSGFFVPALGGFPGTFVHHALDTIGTRGLIQLLEDAEDRKCEFRHCLAFFDGESDPICVKSTSFGTVATAPNGTADGWPLHEVFIPEGWTNTVAGMTASEKNQWEQGRDEDYYTTNFARRLKHIYGDAQPCNPADCV